MLPQKSDFGMRNGTGKNVPQSSSYIADFIHLKSSLGTFWNRTLQFIIERC